MAVKVKFGTKTALKSAKGHANTFVPMVGAISKLSATVIRKKASEGLQKFRQSEIGRRKALANPPLKKHKLGSFGFSAKQLDELAERAAVRKKKK